MYSDSLPGKHWLNSYLILHGVIYHLLITLITFSTVLLLQCSDGSSCINFKTSKDRSTIKTIMSGFLNNNPSIVRKYLVRLKELRKVLNTSDFFYQHEVCNLC